MPNFSSTSEYHAWLEDIITRIYYANIAMNHDKIRECIAEIGSRLHVKNHDVLIAEDDETHSDNWGV